MSNKIHWGINLPALNKIHWDINLQAKTRNNNPSWTTNRSKLWMICDLLALRPISHITKKTLPYLHSTKIEQAPFFFAAFAAIQYHHKLWYVSTLSAAMFSCMLLFFFGVSTFVRLVRPCFIYVAIFFGLRTLVRLVWPCSHVCCYFFRS